VTQDGLTEKELFLIH